MTIRAPGDLIFGSGYRKWLNEYFVPPCFAGLIRDPFSIRRKDRVASKRAGKAGRQTVVLIAIGVAGGLAGAFGLTRLLKNYLWQVSPTDPITFIAVSIGLVVIAVLACLVPTRRAVRVDPTIALRYE